MKSVAFFDVDGTIRRGSASLDFSQFLEKKGLINHGYKIADLLLREKYKKAEINYSEIVTGVVKIHTAALTGLDEKQLASCYKDFITEAGGFFDWTEEFFRKLKKSDVQTVLISAGTFPAITAIGQHLGVDKIFTSQSEILNGKYTGKVTRILHDPDKAILVNDYISNLDAKCLKIGFGDSTGDISMLKLMDKAIIYDPHQSEMVDIARDNGWEVARNGKDLLATFDRYCRLN